MSLNKSKFEEMEVWQDSMDFCEKIYEFSESGPMSEDFGLRDQLRRSALSIPSNIAEGFERKTDKEFVRFLTIAKGSAGELRTQLHLAHRIGYFDGEAINSLSQEIEDISKQIYGLTKYLESEES